MEATVTAGFRGRWVGSHHGVLPPFHLIHRMCDEHASEEAIGGHQEDGGVAGRRVHICCEEVLSQGTVLRGSCLAHMVAWDSTMRRTSGSIPLSGTGG